MRQIILLFLTCFLFSCSEQDSKEKQNNQVVLDSTGVPIEPIIESPKNLKDSIACLCIKSGECDFDNSEVHDFIFEEQLEEVTLVSYSEFRSNETPIILNGSKLLGIKCKEEKKLNKYELNCLKMILNNFTYNNGPICVGNPMNGYFPMHCIVFKDKHGKIIKYLELYFDNYTSRAIDWKEFNLRVCAQYDALKLLFKRCGINEGFDIKREIKQ